jgi:hypothetical protein
MEALGTSFSFEGRDVGTTVTGRGGPVPSYLRLIIEGFESDKFWDPPFPFLTAASKTIPEDGNT